MPEKKYNCIELDPRSALNRIEMAINSIGNYIDGEWESSNEAWEAIRSSLFKAHFRLSHFLSRIEWLLAEEEIQNCEERLSHEVCKRIRELNALTADIQNGEEV